MKSENVSYSNSGIISVKEESFAGKAKFSRSENFSANELPENNPLFLFGCCFIDHTGRQFACINENCHEHGNCFKIDNLNDKLDFHALQFHPVDRILWCEKAYPDIRDFFVSLPGLQNEEYKFSFNHRYLHKDGSISQFLHEGFLVTSADKCFPILSLKVFTEIGDIKTDETIILTIFQYSAEQGYQKVFSKEYLNNENSILSQREREIIKLCLEGLSSKMIASKLNISIHTVKNHKRNSMEKTLTHNIAELINLCIKKHWI